MNRHDDVRAVIFLSNVCGRFLSAKIAGGIREIDGWLVVQTPIPTVVG